MSISPAAGSSSSPGSSFTGPSASREDGRSEISRLTPEYSSRSRSEILRLTPEYSSRCRSEISRLTPEYSSRCRKRPRDHPGVPRAQRQTRRCPRSVRRGSSKHQFDPRRNLAEKGLRRTPGEDRTVYTGQRGLYLRGGVVEKLGLSPHHLPVNLTQVKAPTMLSTTSP